MQRKRQPSFVWGGTVRLAYLSIQIKPPSILAHEATHFMQTLRATVHFVTRDEFDDGMVGVLLFMTLHFQPYPLRFLIALKAQ